LGFLQTGYPYYSWNPNRFKEFSTSKSQRFLRKKIGYLLPMNAECEYNYLSDMFRFGETDRHAQFDLWIPRYNLCIEFQAIS
jgi:hypothetical protein